MEQIIRISEFILKSFIHIWPYLVVTIPLAVFINISGASRYVSTVFGKNPVLSVLLATVLGAFSPFCSCGVIPVITSLLLGGVPLAPVMSFWIASPSMDPEIFFLSTSVIGWKLAVWRLASTFIISLSAGYITHFAVIKGYIGTDILRTKQHNENQPLTRTFFGSIRNIFQWERINFSLLRLRKVSVPVHSETGCCTISEFCCEKDYVESSMLPDGNCLCDGAAKKKSLTDPRAILNEILKATVLVTKFMGLAFLITALINFYLPDDIISLIVRGNSTIQVLLATIIGIPVYTSNITALPLVGGLIELGLNKGAALSFLIAGATTTLPAMVAVWGIAKKRIFLLYITFVLSGALLAGICFNIVN